MESTQTQTQNTIRGRNWCFTLNNYEHDDDHKIRCKSKIENFWNVKYCVIGYEVGASGTPHLQGYVEFKNARNLAGCKKLFSTAHWEIRKGNAKQASEYCKKDGDFFEIGTHEFQRIVNYVYNFDNPDREVFLELLSTLISPPPYNF